MVLIRYLYLDICSRAPFPARINLSHFGDLGFFAKNMYFVLCIFGAGQKNNLSHGPVAQVRMAPLFITLVMIYKQGYETNY